MEISPVCTRKGSGCGRPAVGVGLQHTELSSALHCWMGAVAVSQLDSSVLSLSGTGQAANHRTLPGLAGMSQPGTHSWATAIGKTGQKNPEKTTTTKYPNLQNQNPEQTRVSLPMIWALSKQTIPQTIQLVRDPAEAEQLCYPVQQHCHCLTSPESHIQLQTSPPAAPASLHCLSPWAHTGVFIHRL